MNPRFRRASLAVFAAASLAGALAQASDAVDSASHKVNINQASAAQLAYLPRLGAKAAERIIEYRKTHGQFSRPEELMEVKGIGEKLFIQLKPYLAVSGPTTLTSKVSSKGTRGGSAGKKTASAAASLSKSR